MASKKATRIFLFTNITRKYTKVGYWQEHSQNKNVTGQMEEAW